MFERALDEGLLVRFTGDIIARAPPFISTPAEIDAMIDGLRRTSRARRALKLRLKRENYP